VNIVYRKTVRLAGLALPFYYFFSSKPTAIFLSGFVASAAGVMEWLRLHHGVLNEYLLKRFSLLAKEKERTQITGPSYFAFGAFLTILVFSKPVAILAVTFSVFGDMAATLVGHFYGRVKVAEGKTLEGSAACFAACLCAGLVALQTGLEINFQQVLLGSLAAAIVEVFSSPIDDNLTIPIFAGILMQAIR
jgi:dolichol kinase